MIQTLTLIAGFVALCATIAILNRPNPHRRIFHGEESLDAGEIVLSDWEVLASAYAAQPAFRFGPPPPSARVIDFTDHHIHVINADQA